MTRANTDVPAAASAGDETCDVLHLHAEGIRALRPALIAPGLAATLAETFRALGDPTRVRILDALSRAELCVCDIAALLSISESAVSHQLRLLRSLRLVRSRRAGRMVFYALDDDHITRLFAQGLEHVEEAMSPARREALTGTGR
jgi:ArsR family transcriptional regulator, lead/cadmium/zinc/bismuth-responsive transcriptional repressor